jgi:hypothetical protein
MNNSPYLDQPLFLLGVALPAASARGPPLRSSEKTCYT